MNADRQQAYLNLIDRLLNCPSDDEAEILNSHPELLDDGLVAAMLEVADHLREKGELNSANWLKNFAGLLGKVDGDFLAVIELKAEAGRLLKQGNRQYEISQFREALPFFKQALIIYKEIGDRQGEASSLCNLGIVCDCLGQYDKAIEFHEQHLEISQEIGDRDGEAASLCNLGHAYDAPEQLDKAIEFHEQSLVISREIGHRQWEANALNNLGHAYYSLGQLHKAIAFCEQCLVISREIENRQGEANSLGNLGNAYRSLGQFHRAIEFDEQSLVISREIKDRQGEANALNGLGHAYQCLGQLYKAIEFHEQSLVISREIDNRQGEGASLGGLGNAYKSLGQFHKAIEFHEQSLVISREIRDRQGEAVSLYNLGTACESLGQFHRAIKFHEQSLVISREIRDRQEEANSLGGLGTTYHSLGQFHKAIEFHEQCLVISREIDNSQGESASLYSLGNAYNSLGQLHKAIAFYEQSLEIKREIGDRQGEASSLNSLGNAYKSLGQLHKAIAFYEQSLEISREIGYRDGESALLCNLGNAYNSLGQYQRAIQFYELSLKISQEIGCREWEANALWGLGNTYYQVSNGLRMRYESLPKILAFLLDKIFILAKKFFLEQAELQLLASINIRENMRSQLVNDNHKISFFETQIFVYSLLQQVLVARSHFDEALEISEMSRTRAFVELLRQTLFTNDIPANNETNKLSIPKIQEIARSKNSTIVEYSIIDPEIYIWVIQPNGNITHRAANLEPLNQQNQTLKQIILQTRISIGTVETDDAGNKIQLESAYKRDETGGFPLLKLLHQILIEPIIELLPTDANSPIVFIPHYDLFLLPFAALQDSNNRYLIEHRTILTAPSIQVLETTGQHLQQIRGLRQAALIVGDPKISPKFQENPYKLRQLPRAKEAAESIAQILNTEPISGENATKVAVLDRMLNTRIVHLSAHGLLDDFQGSGIPGAIILAPSSDADDGAIYAGEILQLKLNSELVVLSACSTGCGKITGDGVIGLSRCFILAGVPSIIVSLWNTGAISAKLLMTEFYQNLAKGENRAAALRRAMLTTKAEFPSPIAWAAFTLIGETESLSLETEEVDLRRLKMSLPDDITPEEIVAGLNKLLQISEPQLFAEHLGELAIDPKDNVDIAAQKIREWCESRSQLEENLEKEIYQLGAGGTDSDVSEEIVNELMETIQENVIRLGLSRRSVLEDETEGDSETESVENPT